MARKNRNMEIAAAFILGMVSMLVLISLWNFSTTPRYPNAYMMPMMRMMVGNARSVDCNTLSDSDFERIGEETMAQMIGDEQLHEQMDAQMGDERTMHILMAKMMTGCR